jgi:hypothetical protein
MTSGVGVAFAPHALNVNARTMTKIRMGFMFFPISIPHINGGVIIWRIFQNICPGQADVVHCRNAQIQWEPEKMKAKLCSSAANFLFNVLLTSTIFQNIPC